MELSEGRLIILTGLVGDIGDIDFLLVITASDKFVFSFSLLEQLKLNIQLLNIVLK